MPNPLMLSTPTTLQNMIAAVRQDLMDLDASGPQHWSDAVLSRCVTQALERYSQVNPRMQLSQLPTYPRGRLYPSPDGCWYVDRVEYPVGFWPKRFTTFLERPSPQIAPPAAAPIVSPEAAPAGSLSGAYLYAVSFVTATTTPAAETGPGPGAAVTLTGSACLVSGIPLGPYGTMARNLYRSAAGGSALFLLAQLADNVSTAFTDTLPDASLGAAAPTRNTSGGVPTFELGVEQGRLPADGAGLIEVQAAYRHELDPLGTTVPEQHLDCIAIGAKAHALAAYLTTTNDNFDYVDGQFRDRVDDSKAPEAWRAHATLTMQQFEARLEFIKHESNARVAPSVQWGDKPYFWDRL